MFNLCGTGRVQEQEEERAGAKAELPFLQGKLGGRMMSNMKIGEIRAFRCVEVKDEDNCCVGCMFNDESCCWVDVEILGHCEKAYREDKKDVIFVRTDPNEIIRERIEKSIDKWSNGDDDMILSIESNGGDYRIGFKASYWKQLLVDIMKMGDEDAVQD